MALRTPSEFTSWFDKMENSVDFWKKKYENSEKKFQERPGLMLVDYYLGATPYCTCKTAQWLVEANVRTTENESSM